ncbi:unnamed protein product, partial [Laminaria digitata]
QVELKPDLQATGFSIQNAFFFAKMSKIAYLPRDEARNVFKGNETGTGMGFDHFYWYEADKEVSGKSLFDAIHDTEAFVVANDDVILVVFRGTKELTDWITNLSIRTRNIPKSWGLSEEDCDVHRGFDDGVNTVWDGVEGMHQKIKTLYEEKGKRRKLYIAGHSLGGALATVAAARLAFVDDMNIAGMYTIGSPRVFDTEFAAHFDSKVNHGTLLKDKYFRCRNNNDIVPRIVPSPYCHVGTEIYLDRFGAVATTSWTDRLLGRLSSTFRLSFIDGVNDHSGSEYIRLFKQLVINSKMSLFDKTKSVVLDAAQKVT